MDGLDHPFSVDVDQTGIYAVSASISWPLDTTENDGQAMGFGGLANLIQVACFYPFAR
jgi:hypothetical protein